MARAGRVCAGIPGDRCTEVLPPSSPSPRCPSHARAHEARRGSAARRELGHAHRKATARATEGATHCASCGAAFTSANPPTGGHRRARRYGGTVADGIEAQCRRCNYGWRATNL